MPSRRIRAARALLLAPLALLCLVTDALIVSRADIRTGRHPATQGRPLTPAGTLVRDDATRQPAVGALPVAFVRSPDRAGPDGRGRYLVAVNSGYGVQFNAATNRGQQSLSVIDLGRAAAPAVVQNVYFPSPQSANVGLVFAPRAGADGAFPLYVSGGVENKIWVFKFRPGARTPITPASPGPATKVEAPAIDVTGFAGAPASPRENDGLAQVYPTGLDLSDDGATLFVANNLDDSLGIVENVGGTQRLARVSLQRAGRGQNVYPYGVAALAGGGGGATKVYVSCWNDETVAVVKPGAGGGEVASFIAVGRHPTALIFNAERTRLYVVNSDADSVSVIDTAADREVERVGVRAAEDAPPGHSPEALALSDDGATLYVANAHSNAVAVITLSDAARGRAVTTAPRHDDEGEDEDVSEEESEAEEEAEDEAESEGEAERAHAAPARSKVRGFVPTGLYPSALAVAGGRLFVGNGKGTGLENSSLVVNNSGRTPNTPNDRFPAGEWRGAAVHQRDGGQYTPPLVVGNVSVLPEPDARALAAYTQAVMRNNGLLDPPRARLFRGRSPIRHVVYVIRENRTYDQVFGDLARAGDGRRADGDPSLAVFGAGEAARVPGGEPQNVTPNARALAVRFGLLDRFFVNAEASPDGHNWSTAAFSGDYVDKAFRWDYSGRGRSYDYEGFNRLPNYYPLKDTAPAFQLPVTAEDVTRYMRRYVPYLNGGRDVAEPDTLYLWDAAARAGLSYRNYGEFIGTLSAADIDAINSDRRKPYPDLTPTVSAFPTKKSLEGHHSLTFRNYDMRTPDSMTVDSYRAARESGGRFDPLVSETHADARFRGNSRAGEWLREFESYVADLRAGRGDRLPNLSIVRLPNDHTEGYAPNAPTPQFYVAENDYAVGRIVEAVSESPYWRDTAVVVVEDDAQDGPDHVDAHRSPALIVSAYNRPGALVHAYHNTVSLIRTVELLLGIAPLNQLDAAAVPVDIFRDEGDFRPFKAVLPAVSLGNLITPPPRDRAARLWAERTAAQDIARADMADPATLNAAIWFSVRGTECPAPGLARLPAFDAMLAPDAEDEEEEEARERRALVARKRD